MAPPITIEKADIERAVQEAVGDAVSGYRKTADARLDDVLASIRASVDGKPAQADLLKQKEHTELAEVEDIGGSLESLVRTEVWDIPVGQALVGGFVAVFLSELTDGFMATSSATTRALIKGGLAGASVKWGKKLFGATGAKAIALLLAFDAIRDLTPMDQWADQLATKISGALPAGGLASRETELQALRSQTTQPGAGAMSGGVLSYLQNGGQ